MSVNFHVQIHWSWFKYQELRHTNAEKGAKLGSILCNVSYFTTIMKRFFVTGNKYTYKVKIIYT